MWNQSIMMGPLHIPSQRDSAGNIVAFTPGYHLLLGSENLVSEALAEKRMADPRDMPVVFAGVEPIVVTFADEAEARASDLGQYWGEPPVDGYVQAVPASVTPLQMRKALREVGLKPQVDAYLTTLTEEQIEAWEYATAIERNNELIATASQGLGMTDEQVDDLFKLAVTLS